MGRYSLDNDIRLHKRKKTNFIILSQMINFSRKGYGISNDVRYGTHQLTAPVWEYYFEKDIKTEDKAANNISGIPYHYYIEAVGNDYQITIGAPEYATSPFMKDLVDKGVIPSKYKDSIVVSISENLVLERAEPRLWDILNYRLIVPLLNNGDNISNIAVDDIMYIDDIINYLDPKLDNVMYNIDKARYFNRGQFISSLNKFNKTLSSRS